MANWQEVVALFLLPPGLLIVLAILGFLLRPKWTWLGNIAIGLSIALLTVLSVPLTSRQLSFSLEASAPPLYADRLDEARTKAKAIIVLAGGRYADAPEYGADTVSPFGFERLRYAARVHRQTGLPILLSGGAPGGEAVAEATLMRAALETDLRITPRWLESRSRNTLENAVFSRRMLAAAGIEHVILVTHAWHMRRALWCFERVGFVVTPAPMGFRTLSKRERKLLAYLPSVGGFFWSATALRERLGYLWYQLAYRPEELVAAPPKTQSPSG